MNWGKGIALVMVAFAGMMAYFLVRAAQNPEPLISEHYYEQELQFQQRIDASSRALALGEAVRIEATRDRVRVSFPDAVDQGRVSGSLLLLHANDERDDHTITIHAAPGGTHEEAIVLRPGRYIAQLQWQVDSVSYYNEEQLIVP